VYSLRSFLLTPFNNTFCGQDENNFNYFHSSLRITIECAFGKICGRWGILWKPLGFSLNHNTQVIDACLRLHNFIVDYQELQKSCGLNVNDEDEQQIFLDELRSFATLNPDKENEIQGGE